MTGTKKWEEIRRTTPDELADHQRWAAFALSGATLGDLRRLSGKTQAQVGEAMGISAVEAGRMEKRADVQVSTLVRYLNALGGELQLFARFGEHGEKVVALRIGEFSHQAFVEHLVGLFESWQGKHEAFMAEALQSWTARFPLQPAPTVDDLQVALVGMKDRLREEKKTGLVAKVEYLKAAVTRMVVDGLVPPKRR